jgi:hypothetical protein
MEFVRNVGHLPRLTDEVCKPCGGMNSPIPLREIELFHDMYIYVYYDTDAIFTSIYRHLTSRMTRSFFFFYLRPSCTTEMFIGQDNCPFVLQTRIEMGIHSFLEITKSLFALQLLKDDRGKSIKISRDLFTFFSFEVRRVCFL